MGDFLLLENFSISSQSPRLARALIFSHQYLGMQVKPAPLAASALQPPDPSPRAWLLPGVSPQGCTEEAPPHPGTDLLSGILNSR